VIERGVLHAASGHDARIIALTIGFLGWKVNERTRGLDTHLHVGLRITTLIINKTVHLTIDSKAAIPMKYTRWGRAFIE